jgi:hypothetical protein
MAASSSISPSACSPNVHGSIARSTTGYVPVDILTSAERVSLLDGFFEYLGTARAMDIPALLETSWEDIQRWTTGFYWLPSEGSSRSAESEPAPSSPPPSAWKKKLKSFVERL